MLAKTKLDGSRSGFVSQYTAVPVYRNERVKHRIAAAPAPFSPVDRLLGCSRRSLDSEGTARSPVPLIMQAFALAA